MSASIAQIAIVALGLVASAPIPSLTQRVNDEAGALSSTQRTQIDAKLAQYEQATGHQFAVLIVPTLDGDVLEQYSIKVAEQWRLGDKKRDDGLLMLIAMKEHAIRIEVGYGLEGSIPDVVASRVIRDVMVPKMRNNDVAGAIDDGMSALMQAAAGDAIGAPSSTSTGSPNAQRSPNGYGVGIGVIAVLFFVLLALPRIIRAPLFGVAGAVIGLALWSSLIAAIVLLVVGVFLGAVLPSGRSRGGFFPIFYGGGFGGGGGWSSSGGGGGGFSGGGGGFGGGGASGRW